MNCIKISICIMFCLCLMACGDTVYYSNNLEAPLKVVIVVGQSNCVNAHAKVEELPAYLLLEQVNMYYSHSSRWVYLSPTVEEYFGPELSLAYHLSEKLKEPIGIIKHAEGGTSLAEDWYPRSGYCYDALMAKVGAAQESRDIEIIGVAWMQGERDAKYEDMAYAYADNLATFITCLQADCENPDLRFVAGRINPPQNKDRPYVDIVRKAQKNCSHPNYSWVDCDDLTKDDVTHYDTAGVIELGKRMAEKIKEETYEETCD